MTHTSIALHPHSPSLTLMHRWSHVTLFLSPSHSPPHTRPLDASVFAPCTVPVCMHLCSHIACFMYACNGFRSLHCLHAYVFAHCMFHASIAPHPHSPSHRAYNMGANSPYTHTKVLKAVWERAPIQYGNELTKQPLRMSSPN